MPANGDPLTKTTPAGGPAAINGFLYQILANLAHVSRATLAPSIDHDSSTVVITLEPGAGDATILSGQQLLVEQYKTRSGGRTWSLKEVVTEVMPDLFRAVPAPPDTSNVTYCFVTDGRKGARFDDLQRITDHLAIETDGLPGHSLDHTTPRQFFNTPSDPNKADPLGTPATDKAFFDFVCAKLVAKDETDLVAHCQKVKCLIANFSIKTEATDASYIASINALLEVAIDYRENIESKRRQLYGILLEKSAIGNVEITPEELFSDAGLAFTSIRNRSDLVRAMLPALSSAMMLLGYNAEEDVRPTTEFGSKPVTMFTGESGSGKTWALCSAALSSSRAGMPAVLTRSRSDALRTLQSAADVIWIDGQGHDQNLSFKAVHARLTKLLSSESVPPATSGMLLGTIFIDNVQSVEEARDLCLEIMELPRLRLFMSTSEGVGKAIVSQLGVDKVNLRAIEDFSLAELRALLAKHKREFVALPDDVRSLLRRPVFARLYTRLESQSTFAPENEYELLERYYQHVWSKSIDDPDDEVIVLELVAGTLKGLFTYPWDIATRTKAGLDAEIRKRIERYGLLTKSPDADIEIWHDRVLNWFSAVALRRDRLKGNVDQKTVCDLIEEMYESKKHIGGRSLGYVAMDYLWLTLASATHDTVRECALLVQKLEGEPIQHAKLQGLYLLLLPTLGTRVVPLLEFRLRELVAAAAPSWQVKIVIQALVLSSKADPAITVELSKRMLSEDNNVLQEAGVGLAKTAPSPLLLNDLWKVYCKNHKLLNDEAIKNDTNQNLYVSTREDAVRALRACVELSPSWLDRKLGLVATSQEPPEGLAYILLGIAYSHAEPLWHKHKLLLIDEMPPERMRSLANSIRRFRDRSQIPSLMKWLSVEADFMQQASFATLCELDADKALSMIPNAIRQGAMTASWWSRTLLYKQPDALRRVLCELLKQDGQVSRTVQSAFRGVEDEIGTELWSFWLDEANSQIRKHLLNEQFRHVQYFSPFSFLLSVTRADQLHLLRARVGTEFEENVFRVALGRLDLLTEIPGHDEPLHDAISLLQRINGKRYGDLVYEALCRKTPEARGIGISHAAAHLSENITDALRLIAGETTDPGADDEDHWVEAMTILDYRQDYDGIDTAAIQSGRDIPLWLALSRSASPLSAAIPSSAIFDDPATIGEALKPLLFSGGNDVRQFLVDNLSRLDPLSAAGGLVAATLSREGERSNEFAQFLEPMISVGVRTRLTAANSLLAIKTPLSLEILLRHFGNDLSVGSERELSWDVLLALLRSDLHLEAGARLRQWIERGFLPTSFAYLEFLPEIGEERAHDLLLEHALNPPSHRPENRLLALKGLWKLDGDGAIETAMHALSQGSVHWRREVVNLIVTREPEKATERLCAYMTIAESKILRAAIARALRRAPADRLATHLRVMFDSTDAADRLAACEISGFGGPDFFIRSIENILHDEIDESVRKAAFAAMWRQRAEKNTVELIDIVKADKASMRTATLPALLRRIDPFLAETLGDQLSLEQLSLHEWERRTAKHVLAQRKKRERDDNALGDIF